LKKIFAILLSLSLVISLGVLTVAPVAAVTQPSISPASAVYDLDAPAQVSTTITWGSATDLEEIYEIGGDVLDEAPGGEEDWIEYDGLVVIASTYLAEALTYNGDSVTLLFVFDVGVATLTIAATKSSPAVSPTSDTWVYGSDDGVSTNILWGPCEGATVTVEPLETMGKDYYVYGDLLVIPGDSLDTSGLFEGVGDYYTFAVYFGTCGVAFFTVVATGDAPTISPASATWQVGSTDVVTTTITFNSADSLTGVKESGVSIAGQYTLFDTLLVIHDDYLDNKLDSEGDTLALVLEFDSGLYNCILTITAVGADVPAISPASATYCVGSGDNVTTAINTIGVDAGIASIVDVTGLAVAETLDLSEDYWVDGNTLIIAGDTGYTNDVTCAAQV